MKVLITSGGMEERIDDVRYIGNRSSGKTAQTIADFFANNKFQVTLVKNFNAIFPNQKMKVISYKSFKDLQEILIDQLSHNDFDAVVHAAAVSDFSVSFIEIAGKRFYPSQLKKIDSDGEITVHLQKNPKLIEIIKPLSRNKKILLIGFKLTSELSPQEENQAIRKILSSKDIDYLVHNRLHEISADAHLTTIYNNDLQIVGNTKTNKELAEQLFKIIERWGVK